MADILSSFATATPQQLALSERMAAKVKQLKGGLSGLTQQLIQQRQSLYDAFWSDAKTPPPAAAAALDADSPGATYSLFQHDAALVRMLADRLAIAGTPAAQIAQILPGIPDVWTVAFDDTAKTVAITVKTS